MTLLFRYLKHYKGLLVLALVLASINQIFSLIDPQIFRLLIDNYANKATELAREDFIRGIILLLLASVGVAFISRIAKNFQDFYVNVITERLGTKMYADSVAHTFSLPYAVFEDQRSGELLKKLEKARADSQALIKSFVNIVFVSFVGIAFVLTYAFYVHPLIGIVYVSIIPILGAVTFFISKNIKIAQRNIVRESAALAGSTTETIRNVELVKSLGLEAQEIRRLNSVNDQILQLELKKVKLIRYLSFVQGTLVNALRSALLLLMLWLIFRSDISLGQFFSLLFYSFFIFNPLAELGTVATQFYEAKASNEQLSEVLSMQSEEHPHHPVTLQPIHSIQYRNISFFYQGAQRSALHNVSFTINSGETVAFVGPSGSGKSTLVKLLAGLYKPTSGELLFNGTNVDQIDYDEFRRRIGLVSQETQLFAGTIRENLLFVKSDATDDDCLIALGHASAMNIVERSGKGLDTKIGEGGVKISGGERQRLAIARALLRDPEILVFDEATSSLDSITEKEITETIQYVERIHSKLMTILIAHRLSTVAHADVIYVLEKGKIVEQGSHRELLRSHGLYAALWLSQVAASESDPLPTPVFS
ncbi:MAG: ABC transporter ATP-binding protein [Candidatus Harrisonbacteria bacterium CG10_big_fil_rev_8_21_14_0_10_42_17]|uniref:ABC transporter ATP-binding protein n=1 Tax=Candidatus Harrisonbacteria bacterium CG10_big_fil_rev_8_21_14_0_10_42_17 TaxID=1974584 RepID=A0A2M6WJ49_9BACT|nr:MAG: ABC transporter ATP-binding protein [Candidatus Harrisonbacteria bacterium CG10_big_fil_rev_8_21_14_0_10_42_17]